MPSRNEAILQERIAGATLRSIGERHGVSAEGARQIVIRAGTEHINRLIMQLWLAAKLEKDGREAEAEWPTFLIPFQEQGGWQIALRFFQWCTDQLRDRGEDIQIATRQTTAGVVFQIREDWQ